MSRLPSSMEKGAPTVAIIGGGPAGLSAAEVLSEGGVHVDVYDAMPSVGRKFLLAGKGGLNLTHSEHRERFDARYGARRERIVPLLNAFGPDALRAWVRDLGIDTFVGTSGRVFPTEMKSAPLLRAWLHRLREHGVRFHVRHRWQGWNDTGELLFSTPRGAVHFHADAVVLALGGGSWPQLGSDGAWVPLLQAKGVAVAPLRPSNCGFDVAWSDHFRSRFAGAPVKPVVASFTDAAGTLHSRRGEFTITSSGVEGSVIYALSAPLRDTIAAAGRVSLHLDLLPGKPEQVVVKELARPRGRDSITNHLRKRLRVEGVKAGLVRERVSPDHLAHPETLAAAMKSLPLSLVSARPLEEAISSAGGVMFEGLDDKLMVRSLPGVFCAGEILDWEAPTGGYLLTACFAAGRAAGKGVLAWLEDRGTVG